MRFRNILLIIGSLIGILGLVLTDPDKGISTAVWLLSAWSGVVVVALAHISRKGLFDYIDLQEYAKKAAETSQGASNIFLGVCIVLASALIMFGHIIK